MSDGWVYIPDPRPELASALEEDANDPSVSVEPVLHPGPPAETIVWYAREHDCDLIVMGTHGRTALKHLLLGSVAEKVVRRAHCPVMTVRHHAADEPVPTEPTNVYAPPPPVPH